MKKFLFAFPICLVALTLGQLLPFQQEPSVVQGVAGVVVEKITGTTGEDIKRDVKRGVQEAQRVTKSGVETILQKEVKAPTPITAPEATAAQLADDFKNLSDDVNALGETIESGIPDSKLSPGGDLADLGRVLLRISKGLTEADDSVAKATTQIAKNSAIRMRDEATAAARQVLTDTTQWLTQLKSPNGAAQAAKDAGKLSVNMGKNLIKSQFKPFTNAAKMTAQVGKSAANAATKVAIKLAPNVVQKVATQVSQTAARIGAQAASRVAAGIAEQAASKIAAQAAGQAAGKVAAGAAGQAIGKVAASAAGQAATKGAVALGARLAGMGLTQIGTKLISLGTSAGAGGVTGGVLATEAGATAALAPETLGISVPIGIAVMIGTTVVMAVPQVVMGGIYVSETHAGLCYPSPHFILANEVEFNITYRLYGNFSTDTKYRFGKIDKLDTLQRLSLIQNSDEMGKALTQEGISLAQKTSVIPVIRKMKGKEDESVFLPVKIDDQKRRYIEIVDVKPNEFAKFTNESPFFDGKRAITRIEARFKDPNGVNRIIGIDHTWDVDQGNLGKGYRAYRAKVDSNFDVKNSERCIRLDVDRRSCDYKAEKVLGF